LIHHGGIGTTAAGLAGSVPQVIFPMSHDQPDNAHRIVKLGVGDRLMPRQFTGKRLANILDRLLTSPQVQQCCQELAQRCRELDGIKHTCDYIESAQ
jgi:UDP:flavonoid glycosyltransferase YjiC (YdhE family)